MTYQEILANARTCMGPYCKSCPVCNGVACKNTVPGPGAKGIGTGFIRNYQKWQELCVNMDTICENVPVDTSYNFFGKQVALPVFAAPVGAMQLHYGDKYDDLTYNDILVSACAGAGIAAFTGDGTNPAVIQAAAEALKKNHGCGVPTIKPWNIDLVREKAELVGAADPIAVAMDIDAAGLPFLKNLTPPAGSKSVEELLQADYKEFHIAGHDIAVSQITCMDSEKLLERKEEFLSAMRGIRQEHSFNTVVLMITDVLLDGSQLLFVGDEDTIRQAFNLKGHDNCVFLPKVMSRKKQVIPMLSALWG